MQMTKVFKLWDSGKIDYSYYKIKIKSNFTSTYNNYLS